ncbi:MAG: SEC-C metal-binding domain-containing protein [Fulvivirga sp.]
MQKLGRNEPCHCGSGKKYKNCHQKEDSQKESSKKSTLMYGLIGLFVIITAFAIYITMTKDDVPGNAPEGKVWSPEHGHWHDK